MSGSQGASRERREVIPQAGPVAAATAVGDPSTRDTRMAVGYEAQGMAQVLDPLERSLNRIATTASVERAEREALNEPFQRDGQNRLIPPDVEPGFLDNAYDRKRREVLTSRYASELVTDNRDALMRLRAASGESPDAFKASAEGWRDGLTRDMSDSMRGPVTQVLNREIAQHHNALLTQRLQVDQAAARAQAVNAATLMGNDVRDLALMPPGEARDARLAEGRARVTAWLDANRNVLGGEATEALRRQLLVVTPIEAGLRGQLRRAPASQGQVVTALLGGPGTPGWQAEWAGLTDPERQQMARLANAIIDHQRGEIRWGESRSDRAQHQAAERLQMDAAALAVSDAPDVGARRADLLARTLVLQQQGGIGAADTGRIMRMLDGDRRQDVRERSDQAASEIRLDMARNQAPALAPGGDPDFLRIMDDPRLNTGQRAMLAEHRINELQREADRLGRERAPRVEYQRALAGERGATTERHGEAALAVMDDYGVGRDAWANMGPDGRAGMARAVATHLATGVVPVPLRRHLGQGGAAFASETGFRNAGAMVVTAMENPQARQALAAALGPQQMAAWEAVAPLIAGMPRETPEQDSRRTSEVAVLMDRTAQMMARGPRPQNEIDADLGATPTARAERRRELAAEAAGQTLTWMQRNMSWVPGVEQPRRLGAAYAAEIEARYNHMAQFYGRPADAMRATVESLARPDGRGNGWGPSGTALSADGRPTSEARYVRYPPEQYMARSGRGGTPSPDWQQSFANSLLRSVGVPGRPAADATDGATVDHRLGRDAFWKFDEERHRATGEVRHQLWYRDIVNGVERTDPLTLGRGQGLASFNLAAAAAERTAEWETRNTRDAEAAAVTAPAREAQEVTTRSRARGNPGNIPVEGGAAVRAQPQAPQGRPVLPQADDPGRGWSDRARAEAGLPPRSRP